MNLVALLESNLRMKAASSIPLSSRYAIAKDAKTVSLARLMSMAPWRLSHKAGLRLNRVSGADVRTGSHCPAERVYCIFRFGLAGR